MDEESKKTRKTIEISLKNQKGKSILDESWIGEEGHVGFKHTSNKNMVKMTQ